MIGGIFVWGLGFAAANSMQQARLAAPTRAGSVVALSTSALYIGQAIGSALGSALFVHGHAFAMGYIALVVMIAALVAIVWSRPVAYAVWRSTGDQRPRDA
jgi:DHA1 family inner membrane transport protein